MGACAPANIMDTRKFNRVSGGDRGCQGPSFVQAGPPVRAMCLVSSNTYPFQQVSYRAQKDFAFVVSYGLNSFREKDPATKVALLACK